MKKLFTLFTALSLGVSSMLVQAQTVQTTTTKQTHTATPATGSKMSTTTSTTAKGPLKKDGTPDMRYKANKTTTSSKKTTSKM